MRTILTLLALLVLAVPAFGQASLEGAFGGMNMILTKSGTGEEEEIGQAFLGAALKLPVDAAGSHFFGLAGSYDTESESEGFGIRYYRDAVTGNSLTPGIGLAAFRLDPDAVGIIETNTTLLGPELVLDFNFPLADGTTVPASAMIGYYHRVSGDQGVALIRFGVQLSPSLLNRE